MSSRPTKFGEILQKIRKVKDNSLFDMAKKLSIEVMFLSKMENGMIEIPPYIIDKIAREYGLTKDDCQIIYRAIEEDKKTGNGFSGILDSKEKVAYTISPKS